MRWTARLSKHEQPHENGGHRPGNDSSRRRADHRLRRTTLHLRLDGFGVLSRHPSENASLLPRPNDERYYQERRTGQEKQRLLGGQPAEEQRGGEKTGPRPLSSNPQRVGLHGRGDRLREGVIGHAFISAIPATGLNGRGKRRTIEPILGRGRSEPASLRERRCAR